MTEVPCPGCSKPLALNDEVCPHCRRPRDEHEIEKGLESARQEELSRKTRPRRLLVLATIAGILVLAWSQHDRLIARLQAARSDLTSELDRADNPQAGKEGDSPKSTTAKAVIAALSANPAAPSDPPAASTAPAAAVEIPDAVQAPAPPPRAGLLGIYGVVYNAATNKPVSGATLQFQSSNSGARWAVGTDGAGHYDITLHKHDMAGLTTVMIEAPGYRKGLLEDQIPPYRERSPEARAALVAETSDADLEPVPVRYPDNAQIVELDLVLIPAQKNIR